MTNPKAVPIAMCTMRFVFETIAPFVPTSVPTTNSPNDQYHFFTMPSLHWMDVRYGQRKRTSSAIPWVKDHHWVCRIVRDCHSPLMRKRKCRLFNGERPVIVIVTTLAGKTRYFVMIPAHGINVTS